MQLLLDTHSFLWFAGGSGRLSAKAKAAIADMDNAAYLSTASLWEMAIKINIGKLKLPMPLGVPDFTHGGFASRRVHAPPAPPS